MKSKQLEVFMLVFVLSWKPFESCTDLKLGCSNNIFRLNTNNKKTTAYFH